MDRVATAFEYGQLAQSDGNLHQAIKHYTYALEVFHSAVGSGYDPAFWATILFARAESFLLCKQLHLVESDIKQALIACPQPIFDLVSFHLHLIVTQTSRNVQLFQLRREQVC